MHSVLKVNVGDRFGRLIILETTPIGCGKKASRSKCKCDCGNEIEVLTTKLWKLRSCGCYHLERNHYRSHSKIWRAWQGMKARCYRKTNKRYSEWGGRGIGVCDAIRNDFSYFANLVGEPPSQNHSIDRKDNNGNYSCGKCEQCLKNGWDKNIHWATPLEQSQNRNAVELYEFNGNRLCLSEICRSVNMPMKTVYSRIKYLKWPLEKAISTKIK